MMRQRLLLDDGFNACNINVNNTLNCTLETTLPKQILGDKNDENIVASLKDGSSFVDEILQ